MQKAIDFLKGKKKYVAAVLVGALASAAYLGVEVPAWVKLAVSAIGAQ